MDEVTRKKLLCDVLLLRLLACKRELIIAFFYAFLYKEASLSKLLTGEDWVADLLSSDSDPQRCIDAFRMDSNMLLELSCDLETRFDLKPSIVSVVEKVAVFLYTLARGASNRDVKERFQHSGETISRIFHEVLEAVVGRKKNFRGLAADVIKPMDPEFRDTPNPIKNDRRYYPFFKDCIGSIDGTHISACVPDALQRRFRNRKGFTSFNVMAVCDFDMCFTYVCAGWEGSAHDSRVLNHVLSKPELKFPRPPIGKYYVVDKGYPDRDGFLTPYPRLKYHLDEFAARRPKNAKEAFNRAHSSLRSCVERTFGVLKQRWQILTKMPQYSLTTQTDITIACFALHNYVRRHTLPDVFLRFASNYLVDAPGLSVEDPGPIPSEEEVSVELAQGMLATRERIARMIWSESRGRRSISKAIQLKNGKW